MKAIPIFNNLFVIEGPTNIGVITSCQEGKKLEVYLVDSGQNNIEGEAILETLNTLFANNDGGFVLKAILCTHSHADHAGGAAFLQNATGCTLYSSRLEAGCLLNPLVQGAVTWGGNPIKEITSSYYLCQSCNPTTFITSATKIITSSGVITFTQLPGHYFDMFGVCYKDNISGKSAFFSSDAFFGKDHIAKYCIPYLYNVKDFLSTLDYLSSAPFDLFIPSHGEVVTRATETLEMNKIAILTTISSIKHALYSGPKCITDILKAVADENAITLKVRQYALILSTVKAYMRYLCDEKQVGYKMQDNRLFYFLKEE